MAKKYIWNGVGSITIKKKKYFAGNLLPADIEKATLEKHLKKGEIVQHGFDVVAETALAENDQLKKNLFQVQEAAENLNKQNDQLKKEIEQLKTELETLKKTKAGK